MFFWLGCLYAINKHRRQIQMRMLLHLIVRYNTLYFIIIIYSCVCSRYVLSNVHEHVHAFLKWKGLNASLYLFSIILMHDKIITVIPKNNNVSIFIILCVGVSQRRSIFKSSVSFDRPYCHPRKKCILKFLFLIFQQIQFTFLVAHIFHIFLDFLYRIIRQKRNIHKNPALVFVQFNCRILLQNPQNVQLLRFGHLLYLVLQWN